MIKIENLTVYGFEEAIRGMRNPKNSWDRSDSYYTHIEDAEAPDIPINSEFHVGDVDKDLMMRLAKGGPVHAKYRRYIDVYVDITAPLYWWKEFETYRIGVCDNPSDIEFNSCSTMHKIAAKKFTIDDFSCEHLIDPEGYSDNGIIEIEKIPSDKFRGIESPRSLLCSIIEILNKSRELYLETKDKTYWWQMIQLLPSSYNQKRTVKLNYEVLAGMWKFRNPHKLDEWVQFMEYFKENCPHSEIFTTDFKKQEREDLIEDFSEYIYKQLAKSDIFDNESDKGNILDAFIKLSTDYLTKMGGNNV